MAVTFTANKALLVAQATALADEAAAAGLTALSSALTSFASEISSSSLTEIEFFGGSTTTTSGSPAVTTTTNSGSAAQIWAKTLESAAEIIQTNNLNRIREDFVADDSIKFWQNIANISDNIERLRDLADRTRDGLGIRTVQPYGELGIAILWLLYMEKGKITETDLASETQLAAHVARLNTILSRLRANVSAEGSF